MSESNIKNFFYNKTVFLTGGTGFLGKVLVEKILRVCQVEKLYLLVRPKKDKSVEERYDEFFNNLCFQNIIQQNVDVKEKITFVFGDCNLPNLGLSKKIEEMIKQNTDVIIHAAANVRFDQPLRSAANINVGSTMDILKLARKIPQLKSFVYVSTAFSNCIQQIIDEKYYPPPMTSKELFSLLEGVTDDTTLDKITPRLLKGWPNTYTFTKLIAEHCVYSERERLPAGIVRPSIVFTSTEEPTPGWCDNFNGATGIGVAASLGVLRSFNAAPDVNASLEPCDFTANCILAATWDVANKKSNDVIYYNSYLSEKNFVTWEDVFENLKKLTHKYPPANHIWCYTCKLRRNVIWHKICVFFLHTMFAYVADFVLVCIRQKPLAVENYRRLDKVMTCLSFFTTQKWTFISVNTQKLLNKMSLKDQKLFNFNTAALDYRTYCENAFIGSRMYLLKESLDTVPQAKKRQKILMVIHYAVILLFYAFLYKILKCFLSLVVSLV